MLPMVSVTAPKATLAVSLCSNTSAGLTASINASVECAGLAARRLDACRCLNHRKAPVQSIHSLDVDFRPQPSGEMHKSFAPSCSKGTLTMKSKKAAFTRTSKCQRRSTKAAIEISAHTTSMCDHDMRPRYAEQVARPFESCEDIIHRLGSLVLSYCLF